VETGNRESALLQFSKVIYLYPHLTDMMEEALLKMGDLYIQERKISDARQVYRKLLEKSKREDRREVARRMLNQIDQGDIR
jgi:predicted glycosyltransferase